MKKVIALLLTAMMVLALAACGEKTPASNGDNTTAGSQQTEKPGQQEQTQPGGKEDEKDALYDFLAESAHVKSHILRVFTMESQREICYNLPHGEMSEIHGIRVPGRCVDGVLHLRARRLPCLQQSNGWPV